jgi:phage terminase small subunit
MKKLKRKIKRLTGRESAFLAHITAGMTITQAARAAGYSKKWPGQAGSQAFRNIERKRPKIRYELGLTVQAVMEYLKAHEEDIEKDIETYKNIQKH